MARLARPGEAGGGGLSGAGPGPGQQGGEPPTEAARPGPAEAEGVRGALQRRLSCKSSDFSGPLINLHASLNDSSVTKLSVTIVKLNCSNLLFAPPDEKAAGLHVR